MAKNEQSDSEATYKVAADAFIVLGGDECYGFLNGENLETSGLTSSDGVVDYLKDIDVIETEIEDRVIMKLTKKYRKA